VPILYFPAIGQKIYPETPLVWTKIAVFAHFYLQGQSSKTQADPKYLGLFLELLLKLQTEPEPNISFPNEFQSAAEQKNRTDLKVLLALM